MYVIKEKREEEDGGLASSLSSSLALSRDVLLSNGTGQAGLGWTSGRRGRNALNTAAFWLQTGRHNNNKEKTEQEKMLIIENDEEQRGVER